MSCKVCLSQSRQRMFARACTWEETRPLLPKQRGVHQSAAGGGGSGVQGQAAISSRLNSLRPCSLAEPPLSHALQLRGVRRIQWSEGQGWRWRGCLKSFGMLMSCRAFTLQGVKAWTIRLLLWRATLLQKKITVITCSLQPEHQEVKRKKILVKGGEHKYRQI